MCSKVGDGQIVSYRQDRHLRNDVVSGLTLIDEVTRNPIYRNNARYFQKIIAERNGLSLAADILELAFGLTQKDR